MTLAERIAAGLRAADPDAPAFRIERQTNAVLAELALEAGGWRCCPLCRAIWRERARARDVELHVGGRWR